MPQAIKRQVTIANGASLSGAVALGGRSVVGILMPAAWTAAALTFQGGDLEKTDLANFGNLYDSDGAELSVAADASRFIGFTATEAEIISGAASIKIRSGPAGAAVNQGGDRVITLVLK